LRKRRRKDARKDAIRPGRDAGPFFMSARIVGAKIVSAKQTQPAYSTVKVGIERKHSIVV
jgi:hypothetical protein